jgi:hypothetical protein
MKTVSLSIFKAILRLLAMLDISAKTNIVDATSGAFSKKPRYVVYIPSGQMKNHRKKIPSVKIARMYSTDQGKTRKLN